MFHFLTVLRVDKKSTPPELCFERSPLVFFFYRSFIAPGVFARKKKAPAQKSKLKHPIQKRFAKRKKKKVNHGTDSNCDHSTAGMQRTARARVDGIPRRNICF
jgi:hypothetical protein